MEPHFIRAGNIMVDPSQICAAELLLPDEDDTDSIVELHLCFGQISESFVVRGDAALMLWARLDSYALPLQAAPDCECDRLLVAGIEP